MVTLLTPAPDTLVFRRARSELSGPGSWHLTKDGRIRITACGDFINHFHEIDISTLGEIQVNELCALCRKLGECDPVRVAAVGASSAR
jgi:hypothetical protein